MIEEDGSATMGQAQRFDPPKVSVVVAIHDAENFLQDTLDCIRLQTFGDFECLCMLNACSDGSEGIVRRFAEEDSRFVPYFLEKPSAANARNCGLDVACGDCVVFLDADDLFEPDFLELLHAPFETGYCEVSICDTDCFYDKDQLADAAHHDLNKAPYPGFVDLSSDRGLVMYATGAQPWNKMFLRDFLLRESLRFQDQPNTNDVYFVRSALLRCKSACLVQKCLGHYRIYDGSTKGSSWKHPLCAALAAEAMMRDNAEFVKGLDGVSMLYLDAIIARLYILSLTRSATSGVDFPAAFKMFSSYHALMGDDFGLSKVNFRLDVKYRLLGKLAPAQISWVYAGSTERRYASNVGHLRELLRLLIAWIFVRSKR